MEPGTLLYDPATSKVGEYQDTAGPYALLRPVGGGREWQADPESLRPATDQERLSAGVRAANNRARTDAPFLVTVPPQPAPDCATCAELAGLRTTAQNERDHSAETDANVLLRKHRSEAHPA
ncbi:hypothetical protein [Streptomyces xylophagus]|uniref:hypothetical protein n=1 Tax=Streptomyces xylophagus TaxID=285514 RepID=UPI0005B9B866|nr:hypothetical protein [Streptomyces xylophagus]